ncbi:hypothetical protein [Erwinia sorbitola]|uniref:Cell envelope biogenesis protein TolA n=1 Tax=Erwinia sorbitola TaxID=2681984 RepID=A0A6I6EBA8_9GAMM|nr:hypothetical protein [Erwinia sorbitola]QGU87047.1 hypothetical protein GN242_07375 [Erwinia sorbitola]
MTDTTEIAVLEIKPEQAPSLYVANGLERYLELIRQQVNEVPDLTTAKGRARVASLAAQVSRSKTLIEKPGRDYLRHLKESVKPAEAELRRFVTECDTLRDEVRLPLTEWEAEQNRIKAEQQMLEWHTEALADNEAFDKAARESFESDHEIALLLNDKFDRDAAGAKAEAERQRIAHEEEIKRQAIEQAWKEAKAKAQRDREAAAQREAQLIAQAEKEKAERIAAQERAEREAREAQERTERLAKEAREQAEREKQQAIELAQRKAQEEADRIKRETEQKEAARLAEEKRVADEAAKRAANEAHRKAVGTDVVKGLMEHAGLNREQAIATLKALMNNSIPHTSITY